MKVKISETFKIKNMIAPSFELLVQAIITFLIGIGLAKILRHVMDRYAEVDPDEWFENLINNIPDEEEIIF